MTSPGVLDCGCIFDGTTVRMSPECQVGDHDLGHVEYVISMAECREVNSWPARPGSHPVTWKDMM